VQLALDLHDGPLQDVAALIGDLRLFRSQLEQALALTSAAAHLHGRLEDLESRALAIDTSLRDLVRGSAVPAVPRTGLRRMLEEHVESFEEDTGVHVVVDLRGQLGSLPPARQLALSRVVQQALTNIRAHSGATRAWLRVRRDPRGIHAEIVDNGVGRRCSGRRENGGSAL
jgi:signal transduction histidine kinase